MDQSVCFAEPGLAGIRLSQVWQRLMVQRGLASCILFELGPQVGEAIPAITRKPCVVHFFATENAQHDLWAKQTFAKTNGFLSVVFQWTVLKNLTIILARTPERTIFMISSLLLYISRCHPESTPGPLANLRSFSRAKLKQWICHCLSFPEWVIRDSRALGEKKNQTSVFLATLSQNFTTVAWS